MKRRDFIKTISATGMAVCTTGVVGNHAYAEPLPVNRHFVFLHLGGGWDPTSLCDPKGNILRGQIDAGARNASSPVNRYCQAAIRRAIDVSLDENVSPDMRYAPYLGTFNREDIDNDAALADNTGLSIEMIQRLLAGSVAGNVLSADASEGFDWDAAKASRESDIRSNAEAILEGRVATVNFGTLVADNSPALFNGLIRNANVMNANLFVYDAFYCLYSRQVRILNGVDNRTNGHQTGTRFADTGSMDPAYPDFSALYAAVKGAELPMAFVTDGGGNNETAGLVPRSSANDIGVFGVLANPEGDYLENGMAALVARATDQRRQLLAEKESLPRRVRLKSQLFMVRDQGADFSTKAAELADPSAGPRLDLKNRENGNRQTRIRLGIAAMEAGVASSMQIGFGGFDTHNDHDDRHFNRIRDVLVDLHFLWQAIDVYGLTDKTTVILGSDFGRTPWFNSGDGKDHWAVTSYVLMGEGVVGGSVVDATDPLVGPRNVRVEGGQLVPTSSNSEGIRMTPAHLHKKLREAGDIQNHVYAQRFPIDAEDLPMLG